MFGPDKCGTENKYHFIVRYKNPVKGTYEEKHAKKSQLVDSYYNDGKTHLYTLSKDFFSNCYTTENPPKRSFLTKLKKVFFVQKPPHLVFGGFSGKNFFS